MAYITIVKGDDTDFLGNQYLVVNFNTDMDLVGFKAVFKLGNIVLTYPDLTAKYIEIILSKEVTSGLPKGKLYGTLQLIDTQDRVRTVTTVLPFNVVTKVIAASQVTKNSIQLDLKIDKNELNIDMNIVGLSKVVAEGYLKQMEDCNNELDSKIVQIRNLEKEIESLKQETLAISERAEEWAESDSIVGENGHSSKFHAQEAEKTFQKVDNIYAEVTNIKEESEKLLSDTSVLVEEGKKVFLNHSVLSNCILNLPHRIKYTLENSILVIKAGSIVMIPYGMEDLSADYPIGTLFLNENLRVYDIQFTEDVSQGNKFFVWVELQNDIPLSEISADATGTYFLMFGQSAWMTEPKLDYIVADSIFSGDSAPATSSTNSIWYDTVNNQIKTSADLGVSWAVTNNALPFMRINISSGVVTSVLNVFNGIGYIGKTLWVDKDVKGLIPNGRNEDGSLKSIEYTTDKFIFHNCDSTGIRYALLTPFEENGANITDLSTDDFQAAYDKWSNYISDVTSGENLCGLELARLNVSESSLKIEAFNSERPVKLPTIDNIDGVWNYKWYQVHSSTSTSSSTKTADLSDLLPDDGHDYEIMVMGYLNNNTGTYGQINVRYHYKSTGTIALCSSGEGGRYSRNWGTVIIGPDRKFMYGFSAKLSGVTCQLTLGAYRRVGTNI